MGIIPQSKFGKCSQCGDTSVPCVKVGKELFCRDKCHRGNKVKQQMAKANLKQQVRQLVTYQRAEGIVDNVQELTIDIDRILSRYIRLRDMEADGKITCFCCDKRISWQKAHAMHFISRQHMGTRFLIQNLKSGCFTCNVEKRGNLEVYKERLTPEVIDFLIEQSHTVSNVTRDDLKEILIDLQFKLKNVESKLK